VVCNFETGEELELVGPVMAVYKRSVSPQAKRSTTSSSVKSSSQRADSQMKETRDAKYQKTTPSASKSIGGYVLNAANAVFGSGRKPGDDRRSPERTSPRNRRSPEPSTSRPSRRASRDTGSKQIQYPSLGYDYDQTTSYPQSVQPTQDWQIQASPSTYTRSFTTGPYGDEITVEVAEPEEIEHPPSPERPVDYYHGRPNVSDGM